ncbi:hypothetical protein [Niveispirillum sp. BGYR6]|uniref:hypothetical protein n=1 Tax=Niveispirillum sp. BGYR6 TaxID=2971249 RepID=UPI0022B9C054|nr:hypothetical protein [Niveispirillum sp. BGYR6]MDG5497927.1 hypothetical protein [Niveispirillum sp. BGYR6]
MTLSQEDVLRQLAEAVKADGLPWTPSGKAEQDRASVATERPELDLGPIPPGMEDEARAIQERYRLDPSYDATKAIADFNVMADAKKAETGHLIHDAHSAEERRHKLWESLSESMRAVDKAFSKLDPYLTDEEKAQRTALQDAMDKAETEEEKAAAARRKLDFDLILAGKAKDRALAIGDTAGAAAASGIEDKVRDALDKLNQIQEMRIQADMSLSDEQRSAKIAQSQAENAKLAENGDIQMLRDQIVLSEIQLKAERNPIYGGPDQPMADRLVIAEQLAEIPPQSYEYQEACPVSSKEPTATSTQKPNLSVIPRL